MIVREYLRVSKDRSERGKSPEQQHNDNVRSIENNGWVMHPDPPYRDNDRSASQFARKDREDFKRLVADLENDTFGAEVLAIWESSRGSRRVGEWVDLVELCAARRVRVWVTTHGRLYDPRNPRDRRSLLEDAVDAEYESAKTSERIKRDVRAAAEDGRPHGKNLYGYQRTYRLGPRGPVLDEILPHLEQAPIVQEAARRILEGDSLYAIAKDFNARGIPPRRPPRKDHRSNLGWTPPAVKQMLTVPAYAGKRQHRGEILADAVWPALIEYESWQKLQSLLSPASRKRTNDWPAVHLLSGIAVCGVCGASTRVSKQNKGSKRKFDQDGNPLPREQYYSYICVGVPGKTGFHVAMKEDHLDKIVTELLFERVERPDSLALMGEAGEGTDEKRRELIDEITGYQRYLDQVREQAAEKLDVSILIDQQARIEPKIKAAQERLEKLSALDPLVLKLIADGSVREAWDNELTLAQKRRVVRAVMRPQIMPVGRGWKGIKGPNAERVVPGWR
ncbi:recombinase family protein [Microbacterium oryzae]|uniref:recombinase family protein n=1 Tax=Microbacterium oryzae TaxID=743009 RepID=UPI0025B251F5|nr:recombinase family protein [Microbacterium oryzae]MDN3311757.1 recombinase family protein [Microbacterium oryzae]